MYLTWLIRGMTIDEALKQMSFQNKKGASVIIETLLEAQALAVEKHNVEFKTNLWVGKYSLPIKLQPPPILKINQIISSAESYATKAMVIKGIRRHAKMRTGEVRYTFSHYFVRLEEGTPPVDYYKREPKNKDQLLEQWKESMRCRKASGSL